MAQADREKPLIMADSTFTAARVSILAILSNGGEQGVTISHRPTFAHLLDATQLVATASVLCTLAEMAEFAGREGPDLLHGGIVSYYNTDDSSASFSYETEYRPLSLEPLNSGLFGALDAIINSSCDSRLVLATHLWPLPWLQSCYLAAIQNLNGERALSLIGPHNQSAAIPMECEAHLVSGLINARVTTFNHGSSAIEALLMLNGMPIAEPGDWDFKLLSEYDHVHAIRTTGNDLFSDLWSHARFSVLLNEVVKPKAK